MISDRGLVYITAAPMDGRFRRITSAPLEWRVRNGQQEYKGIYKVKGDKKHKVSHKTKQSYPTAQQALAAIKEESGQIKTLPTDLLYLLQSDASPRSEHVVKATAHVAACCGACGIICIPKKWYETYFERDLDDSSSIRLTYAVGYAMGGSSERKCGGQA